VRHNTSEALTLVAETMTDVPNMQASEPTRAKFVPVNVTMAEPLEGPKEGDNAVTVTASVLQWYGQRT